MQQCHFFLTFRKLIIVADEKLEVPLIPFIVGFSLANGWQFCLPALSSLRATGGLVSMPSSLTDEGMLC